MLRRATGLLHLPSSPIGVRHAASLAPIAERALQPLLTRLPRFDADGSTIEVFRQPVELKSWLLENILRARRRIFLSALYIGKEEQWIIDALRQALQDNEELTVRIAVDYFRTTREGPPKDSASLLAPLRRDFPNRIIISLYHTPLLRDWYKAFVPPRYNEGWGVWHSKIYGIDDDVLISGANLSHDYFTNRQDRYIAIPNHRPLADFFHYFLRITSKFSFDMASTAFSSRTDRPYMLAWPHANVEGIMQHPDEAKVADFAAKARFAIGQVMHHWVRQRPHTPLGTESSELDTQIRPFFQIGHLNIRDETEMVVPALFQILKTLQREGARPVLDWTSGYFSLDPVNIERILDTDAAVRVICASPQANGFFGSKGVSGLIPGGYTILERAFHNSIVKRGKLGQIQLKEWSRLDWTYHAKGIWLSPDSLEPPSLTVVGSSNYGVRSSYRDVETNLLMTTSNPELRLALASELAHLGRYASTVTGPTFEAPERQTDWMTRTATRLCRSML